MDHILDSRDVFWVWSDLGPAADGVFFGFPFFDGMVPAPVCSRDAEKLRAEGYLIQRYEPGTWVTKLKYEDGCWSPDLETIGGANGSKLPSLSGVDLPERLPGEYLALARRYTASGKLRRKT